jgi:DHA2 family multidrug resistance protein
VRGFNALQIGQIMFVTGIFQFLSAPIAGRLASKVDLRVMLAFGLLMFGGGVWLQAQMTSEWGFWEFFLPQAVRGFALMFLFIPINAVALGTLPPARLKNASGLYNLMRNLGGAIGIAACATILNDRTNLHFLRLAEHLTPANPAMVDLVQKVAAAQTVALGGDAQRGHEAALRQLWALTMREAQTLTYADAFLVLCVCLTIAALMVPLMRKVAPPKGPSADAH